MSEMLTLVRRLVTEQLGLDINNIDADNAALVEGLGADSLDILELIMHLEDLLDIEIDDEVFRKQLSMNEISKYLEGHSQLEDPCTIKTKQTGITLIEVMIIITIVGIAVLVAIVNLSE